MPSRSNSVSRAVRTTAIAGLLVFVLASCAPESVPSPAPSVSATDGQTPAPTPEVPTFLPDGTAEDNLPVFSAVTAEIWASDKRGSGRAYVDALVAAGFDRSLMQVTQDLSTVGNAAESMQFSVQWGEKECLIGQVGPSTGEPVTKVMDQLAEGRCLVGNTRPIDW